MLLPPQKTPFISSKPDPLTAFVTEWQRFWHVYRLWWRADDLERLMRWAKRKRIKQYSYYEYLWLETHQRLSRTHLRLPILSKWAYRLYQIASLLTPTTRYYTRGSAGNYRRQHCN